MKGTAGGHLVDCLAPTPTLFLPSGWSIQLFGVSFKSSNSPLPSYHSGPMNAMAIVRVEEGQCRFRLGFFFLKCTETRRARKGRVVSVHLVSEETHSIFQLALPKSIKVRIECAAQHENSESSRSTVSFLDHDNLHHRFAYRQTNWVDRMEPTRPASIQHVQLLIPCT